jgi:hypothetical protein
MRSMACGSMLVLLASAGAARAQEGGWRLDQVAGRQALGRGELGLATELLSSALDGAGLQPGRASVLEDLFAVGVLLADEGALESAIEVLRISLRGRKELYGDGAERLEAHLTLLGTLELRTRGRRSRKDRRLAAEHLDAARRILERSVGTDHDTTRQASELAVEALRRAGRRQEARALETTLENRRGAPLRAMASTRDDAAQLRRLERIRRDLTRRKADEADAIRAAPSGRPGLVLPAPKPVEQLAKAEEPPPVAPPRAPRLPSVKDQAAPDPLKAQLERYHRLLQAHEGWVRHAVTREAPAELREQQALSGLAELEELSYQADRLRLEAALGERADVTAGVEGLEARIEGLLPDYGALAGGLGGAL